MLHILLLVNTLASLVASVCGAPLSEGLSESTTTKHLLLKRQLVLTDSVWTSTSSGVRVKVTPTVIDGVTISASPVTSSATDWISLDKSGIPTVITPTLSGTSTISASPTPTETDYPDVDDVPPVLRCFGSRVPNSDSKSYPFCTALNGTEFIIGETYWLTWDPTYWGSDDITRVKLQLIRYPIEDDLDPLFTSDYVSNADGYYPLEVMNSYKGYFFLTITPLASSGTTAKHVGTKRGPLLRAIKDKSDGFSSITRVPSDNERDTSSSSGNSNKAKVIAPAVVVPVVVILLIAFGVIYYFWKLGGANSKGANSGVGGVFIRMKKFGASGGVADSADVTKRGAEISDRSDISSFNSEMDPYQSSSVHDARSAIESLENPFAERDHTIR